nr:glycosyltransferase family 2 protein [Vampirovibrio sp.]
VKGRPARVRNVGLKHAQGDFITFMDADDVYYPEGLKKLLLPLTEYPFYEASMAFPYYHDKDLKPLHISEHLCVDQQGEYVLNPKFQLDWYDICAQKWSFFLCCTMFRRHVIQTLGELDEELSTSDDFKYHVQLFGLVGFDKVRVIPDCTYQYRNYAGSITKRPERLYQKRLDHYRVVQWMFQQPFIPQQFRYLEPWNISGRLATIVSTLCKMNRRDLAKKMMAQTFYDPEIPFLVWIQCFWKTLIRSNVPYWVEKFYMRNISPDGGRYFQT